jgi:hypothetical protein
MERRRTGRLIMGVVSNCPKKDWLFASSSVSTKAFFGVGVYSLQYFFFYMKILVTSITESDTIQ